jgi:hypothetical protein
MFISDKFLMFTHLSIKYYGEEGAAEMAKPQNF